MKFFFLLAFIFLTALSNSLYSQWSFNELEGIWQVGDSDAYEEWNLISQDSMIGQGYRLKETGKHILEYLELTALGDQVNYKARVPNQNDGRSIVFKQSSTSENCRIFENRNHDFPNFIEYCLLDDVFKVRIGSNDGESHELILIRK